MKSIMWKEFLSLKGFLDQAFEDNKLTEIEYNRQVVELLHLCIK